MRYFIEFAYNGKHYHGWQYQPNAVSVQQEMERVLSTMLREPVELTAAGRTDAGVHARQMFAHFDLQQELGEEMLIHKINSFLPQDIAVKGLFSVKAEAHARFDATSRSYEYWVVQSKDPFMTDYAHCVRHSLDVEAMNEAAKVLFDYDDFQCFSKSNTDVKTYLCKISRARWVKEDGKLVFYISADRFLRNMVRAIVGTLLDVGLGRSTPENVKKIIESKNRSQAGVSVPAHGLYLTEVEYPSTIFKDNG